MWRHTGNNQLNYFQPVFIDAPHILKPADVFPRQSAVLDAEDQKNQAAIAATDPSSFARAWWTYDRERSKAIGLEESLIYIRDILRGGKFDVWIFAIYSSPNGTDYFRVGRAWI